jgi:S-adenosylmethionine:tRNA ribosyltransferase-isomerase
MNLADFHYDLPAGAIAQEPIDPRDHSRLLVLDRRSKAVQHKHFYDIVDILRPGDFLVTNSTKVFPARLRGRKKSGGKVDVLLMSSSPAVFGRGSMDSPPKTAGNDEVEWIALVRGTTQPTELVFPEGLQARMTKRLSEGEWVLEFSSNHVRDFLDRHGEMPLPPYIRRSAPRAADLDRYQTVYAEREGAVAAPTAGFHFTPQLLERIHAKGITVRSVVLHVGWGTFRPVRTQRIEDHKMLPETYDVSEIVAEELNDARRKGQRIIAVGTTAVRTLETICDHSNVFHAGRGDANLFIYPGYRFKAVNALITNFHLPDSTPLLLACAFYASPGLAAPSPLGRGPAEPGVRHPFSLGFAYEEAIRAGYRFYSYGDAMFIQ